ncbi:hypothetical protein DSM03_108133 [Leeuwenhoekiella aestuarii]|uniref:PH (Pleckstrin Homology) domain-containing protein n=2 Tax=Leeuwenhoekiella TaxID=283735 RepID=A0A4Q0NQU2_9FLAO|nr:MULTISPECIES: hypothetical protein [Leeuwenhoekiella]RXG12987.1 hypothetical protein DSM03_108133 [Leeuwenhoekiella aestuarii]RXG13033.1 hypothetical protein DSM04_10510 [Leeuwenhoekiella aestuarii]RXG14749.1 hypothetical protein DSM02_3520 [Leeuwenhoekiella polynyae]
MKSFNEVQRFDQWWLRLLLVVILAIAVSPLVMDWDTLKLSRFEIASVVLSILVILGLFLGFWYIFKLETTINEKGITYRFVPFHIKSRFKSWKEIKSATIRKYHPIREYGGWGYRISFTKRKALTTKGNKGIQLIFNDGNELLLGTQQPEKIMEFFKKYNIPLKN